MIPIIFFSSHTFLEKEMLNALNKRTDIRLSVVNIPYHPPANAVKQIFEQIKPRLPALILSLNNGGYDNEGNLCKLLSDNGSYLVNWYYDDPVFDHVILKAAVPKSHCRIDFVSEASLVPFMSHLGYNAHFLPLATDPAYFNMDAKQPDFTRDVAFVGNSSLEFIEGVLEQHIKGALDNHTQLIADLKKKYYNNPTFNIRRFLFSYPEKWKNKITIHDDLFIFAMEWMVGYLYRRDFISTIAQRYKERFMCYGDAYWSRFIDPSQVSTAACYYDNLCSIYRSTRVNININRIQIRTAFTQRIFDCKASGTFVLTDKRELNSQFFKTSGPQAEIIEFSSPEECMQLIDYYCKHEDERQKIALNGREKILTQHTYDVRLEQILAKAKEFWGVWGA